MKASNLLGVAGGDASIVSELSLTSSGGSLTLASGDGNISGGAVTIDGVNGTIAPGGFITISLGIGMATSLGCVALSKSNAGTAGMVGDLFLNTGTVRVGDSGALGIGRGASASGSGSSIAISVGSGTNNGGAFSVMAGDSSGPAGGDVPIFSGSPSTSSNRILTLALEDGNTSRGAVTIDGGDGSTALGGSIIISLGIGMAIDSSILPFASVWLSDDEMQLM